MAVHTIPFLPQQVNLVPALRIIQSFLSEKAASIWHHQFFGQAQSARLRVRATHTLEAQQKHWLKNAHVLLGHSAGPSFPGHTWLFLQEPWDPAPVTGTVMPHTACYTAGPLSINAKWALGIEEGPGIWVKHLKPFTETTIGS